MLKIHFTGQDLTRIRVLDAPDPLWETMLSLHLLQDRAVNPLFSHWQRETRAGLDRSSGMLATLAPPIGYSADFLTPGAGFTDIESGIDAVLETPKARLREETALLAQARPLSSWNGDLADARPPALRQLGTAMRRYFDGALAPHWASIKNAIGSDAAARGRALLGGGVERLLSTLNPGIRWRSPVLEVDYPVEQEMHLEGRGLTLVPSFFCWRTPVTLLDPSLPPVLAYPVGRSFGWEAPIVTRSLENLLGRTRASVLCAIGAATLISTNDLAKALGISAAGASQHATVLREAGVIGTERRSGAALHSVTELGSALLSSPSAELGNREVC
ncbi:hypothetical protein SAMN05421504_101908 [Amycolatopsis xylanica]|uniref:Helix-turn-helix domain-containing protein n=1 Tax=Amycolatopsis xylanica TaxID=589385 RepID=A0A1H2UJF8_9PSEU|nr:transcriptional regulator [Amycolatopsis xylanica]SDW56265.1 hypothetical protein SAMN05421504_101908 [Amycolatopsis xylanica]